MFDTRGILADGVEVVSTLLQRSIEEVTRIIGMPPAPVAPPPLPWTSPTRLNYLYRLGAAAREDGGYIGAFGIRSPELEELIVSRLPLFLLPHQCGAVARMILQETLATNMGAFEALDDQRSVSVVNENVWTAPNLPFKSSGGVLWADTGAGKTIMALALALVTGVRTLCVVPAGLVRQWESEANQFGLPVYCMYGNTQDDGSLIVVTSYNTLLRRLQHRAVPECGRVVFDEGTERHHNSAIVRAIERMSIKRRWVLTASIMGRKDSPHALLTVDRLLACTPYAQPTSYLAGNIEVSYQPRAPSIESAREMATGTRFETASAFLGRPDHHVYRDRAGMALLGRISSVVQRCDAAPPVTEIFHTSVPVQQDTSATIEARAWWGWSRNTSVVPILRLGLNFNMEAGDLIERLRLLRPDDVRQFRDGRELQMQPHACSSINELVAEIMRVSQQSGMREYYQTQATLLGSHEEACPICLDEVSPTEAVLTQCGHLYHKECAQQTLRATGRCWCRFVLRPGSALFSLSRGVAVPEHPPRPASRLEGTLLPTTKLLRVLEHSYDLIANDTPHLIFVDHAMTARFIAEKLEEVLPGKARAMVDIPITRKHRIMRDFQAGKFDVLVLTYKAGGVGINFQRASTILMADVPLFNQEYQQAVGRVARYGQQAGCVNVVRFFVENTVESVLPWEDNTFRWSDINFGV